MGMVRFLLASWVVVTHSAPIFGAIGPQSGWTIGLNGDLAVTCFFVISGFLITMILNEKYSSLSRFYVTRSIRIYAPYFVALALAALVYAVGFEPGYDFVHSLRQAYAQDNWLAILYFLFANGTIFGTEAAIFLGSQDGFAGAYVIMNQPELIEGGYVRWIHLLMVPQAWTLSLELQFYLLAPLLCRLRPGTLAILTIIGYFFQESLIHFLGDSGIRVNTQGSIAFNLHYFLFGAIAYFAYRENTDLFESRTLLARTFRITVIVFSFLLVLKGYSATKTGVVRPLLFYSSFAFTVPFLFDAFKNVVWDRFVGELSYPIYLFHFALLPVARYISLPQQGFVLLTITTLLSVAYLLTLHAPIERMRKRAGARSYMGVHHTGHGDAPAEAREGSR